MQRQESISTPIQQVQNSLQPDPPAGHYLINPLALTTNDQVLLKRLLGPSKHRFLSTTQTYQIRAEENRPSYSVCFKHSLVYRDCFKHTGQYRYVIINHDKGQRLGKGSFGQVFKSAQMLAPDLDKGFKLKERKADKHFAAKIMTVECAPQGQSDADKEFANTPAEFKPQLIQYDRLSNNACLLMKKLPGKSLYKVLKMMHKAQTLPYSGKELAALGLAILQAYKRQVYDRGFVHGDLKPANILVKKSANAWIVNIIDHAFALPAKEERIIEQGTPHYMPLDLFGTNKFDVYSLGLILLEVFQDVHRDHFDERHDVAREHKNGVKLDHHTLFKGMNLDKEVEIQFRNLLGKMLKQRAKDRIDFLETLRAYEKIMVKFKLVNKSMTLFARKNETTEKQAATIKPCHK